MAPPTPVYSRDDILAIYGDILKYPLKYSCELKSLTQYECTFRIVERNKPPEIICLPFKRVFQRCLLDKMVKEKDKKKKIKQWVNIEITDEKVNKELLEMPKYGREVEDFLSAEKDLKKLMLEETERDANEVYETK